MSVDPNPEFRIEHVFAAPRAMVWDAWTSPEQLAQWFGPKGCDTKVLTLDLRPGGMLHMSMKPVEHDAMFARFIYREIAPLSRLVYEHGFGDAAGNPAAPFIPGFPTTLLTTVDFEDEGEGTRIKLSWAPLDTTPEQSAVFTGMMDSMTGGWGGSFEVLEELLAAD